MPSNPLIDLSDLDPFSPSSSRSISPHPQGSLFPTSSTSTSTSGSTSVANGAARVPAAKQDVQPQAVRGGADPLLGTTGDLLGGLSLSGPPASRATSSEAGLGSRPAAAAVQAQTQRQSHILADLNREPFTAEPSPSSSSSSSAFPAVPSSSSPTKPSHPPPHPHHPHPPFSPPRRLSTLMSPSSPSSSFAPSSPPAESSVLSDPFHPDLEGWLRGDNGVERGAERRMREASGEWGRSTVVGGLAGAMGNGTGLGGGGDADANWGDFVEAPPTPTQPNPAFTTTSSSSRQAPPPPPPVPIVKNGPSPSSSFSSATLSAASVQRSSTYPDPSLLSVRSSHAPSASHSKAPSAPNRSVSTTPVRSAPPPAGGGGGFDPAAGAIRLVGVRPGVVRVLDEDVAEGIRPSLPPRLRLSPRWTLLYSLDQHGISLSTLFSQLEKGLKERDGGFVLVIRTEREEVLGGYVSEALKRPGSGREERGKERWVGDGSCFLFLTRPFPPTDPRLGLIVKPFRPTFRNTFFAHASPPPEAFLAFGGGNDGVFGLWVDGQMERGWTGRSETYGNEPLVSRGGAGNGGDEVGGEEKGKFEIVGLECWAVGT